jgi:hypothetical protein
MMTAQRLQEICRFHAALTIRSRADPTALSMFERQIVVDVMAELIEQMKAGVMEVPRP